MYYVYVLKRAESSSEIYIGYTSDLKRRFHEHQKKNKSFTGERGRWKLIYHESYLSEEDAQRREKMLKKHGSSKHHLKSKIKKSLES
ncbi:hypothetical protein COV42_02510 [Candidatus Campbellbacteria bacterium CG11_big_fil_rev_8_21_14_0_20_44_21]|uniref:GIY-YIG domain-containing protein n=1 Tax=Candidatus Campbellbacteria bacterium CG22_combo_CG10-13_8_21_14_all_43_18 TaxID=1974530 RepID=A0A2H0DYL9_9BACT|nr:MAG: hypothetical protein COW82_00585 [Candidatus Campbellbacteria bacterium CG22_combo_CG10-13_8_21_14_all_43_18]PIR24092.1 MAG: hypothetical protein COV42_02510 [Candidatus Campbellbacteria bacterium CG11_big_fil_rev_8_21_14_0_20_44_21]